MNSAAPPNSLPLNVIDRQFLVPETDDFSNGAYLPMTIAAVVHPRQMPSIEELRDALIRLDDSFSHYRLSYRLDPGTPRWVRVPAEDRIAYLNARVQVVEGLTVDEHLAASVQQNLQPLDAPVNVFLCEDAICVHLYHPFGDGRFLFELTARLLAALYRPEYLEQSGNRHFVPLREVVMSSLPQAMKVLGHTARRMGEKAGRYITALLPASNGNGSAYKSVYQPTVSDSDMQVMHIEIPPETMAEIRSIVQHIYPVERISLNTFFQIYFAFRLEQKGLVEWPVELTTLVDLRRYMSDPGTFYPGNCIGNIRLTMQESDFVAACVDFQTRIAQQVKSAYPLSDIVGNWFLSWAGDTAFKQVLQDWHLKGSVQDRRFFTLTNTGRLDDVFEPVNEYILPDVRLVTPIMGAAPLVIAFVSYNDYGHFTATYKPDILSREDILEIFNFDQVSSVVEEASRYA